VEPHLGRLWEQHGLAPERHAGFFRWLYLDVAPPTLQFPYAATIATRQPLRLAGRPGIADTPDWLNDLGSRPCVYVTLGTTKGQTRDTDFFRMVMAALAEDDVDVVITVGPGDPAALDPLPSNARAESFIPQELLLPRCGAVVSNGGAGSTMGALAAGVPVLIVPGIAASQSRNARAVVRCGAGRSLEREALSPDIVRREAHLLLEDISYSTVARRIADEIETLPQPANVVPSLEALASTGDGG